MDASAIKQIQESAIRFEHIDICDMPVISQPDNMTLKSLEPYMGNRSRFRAKFKTNYINDFAQYVKNMSDDVMPKIFIDSEHMLARAIFNIGTIEVPGHADNIAIIDMLQTAEYRALLAINERIFSIKEFAEFLEDWRDNITTFDAAGESIEIKRAIAGVRNVTVESLSKSDHEQTDLKTKRTDLESIEAKSREALPVSFTFSCIPFNDFMMESFMVRISILMNRQEAPCFKPRIVQLEKHIEDIGYEFAGRISSCLELVPKENILSGTFEVVK